LIPEADHAVDVLIVNWPSTPTRYAPAKMLDAQSGRAIRTRN